MAIISSPERYAARNAGANSRLKGRPVFGKLFESTFTGSMAGSGATLFAVWAYVIANTRKSNVELNPLLIAALIGETPEAIQDAIDKLCEPDPKSRSKDSEGRRLVREGQFLYHVVNYSKYRATLNEDDRRAYFRDKKRESRDRQTQSNALSNVSTQAEACTVRTCTVVPAESESEAHAEAPQQQAVPAAHPAIVEINHIPRAPIHDNGHRKHAHCGRICLPAWLFTEFMGRRNHDNADRDLREWAMAVEREWGPDGPKARVETGDAPDFWRARYSERWPSPMMPKPSNKPAWMRKRG